MIARRTRALGAVLLLAGATTALAPLTAFAAARAALRGDAQRVDLAAAAWVRNGRPEDSSGSSVSGTPPEVRLPFTARGVRWATEFETADACTARLLLDWQPGPDGLLFEVVLDGVRLSPPRDGWRPTSRPLVSDLGSAWLGRGAHLLEFVAREESPAAALHLRALELQPP